MMGVGSRLMWDFRGGIEFELLVRSFCASETSSYEGENIGVFLLMRLHNSFY